MIDNMIDKIMDRIAWGMSIIGGFVLFLMLVVTIADVVADKLLKLPFPGATELVMSIMPISVCAFLLSLQIKKRHIVIDIMVNMLRPKARVFLQLLTPLCGIFLFGLLTWLSVPLAIHSVRIGEHTGGNVGVPMYPAKIMIPIATGLVTIQLIIELVRMLRDWKKPQAVAAPAVDITDNIS
jgi:TRAP-type mannitol/chloroaromatic compound transport system permease small subunit